MKEKSEEENFKFLHFPNMTNLELLQRKGKIDPQELIGWAEEICQTEGIKVTHPSFAVGGGKTETDFSRVDFGNSQAVYTIAARDFHGKPITPKIEKADNGKTIPVIAIESDNFVSIILSRGKAEKLSAVWVNSRDREIHSAIGSRMPGTLSISVVDPGISGQFIYGVVGSTADFLQFPVSKVSLPLLNAESELSPSSVVPFILHVRARESIGTIGDGPLIY